MKILIKFILALLLCKITLQDVYCPSSTASYLPEPASELVKKSKWPTPTCESCPDNCL